MRLDGHSRPSREDYGADEETGGTRSPIGVGKDYTADVRDRSSIASGPFGPTTSVKPRYWTGDEWTTPKGLANEDRASLQLLLKQLGFIDPKARLVLGQWDQKSATGFKNVLAWANTNGTDWQTALGAMAQSSEQFPQDGELGERAPFSPEVANPLDLRAALKQAATEVLGGGITDEQIAAISDRFQQQQIGAQRSTYNTAETGGTSVAAPSFENFAEEQVRALDPIKADSRSAVKVASVIQQMMEGKMPSHSLPGEGG